VFQCASPFVFFFYNAGYYGPVLYGEVKDGGGVGAWRDGAAGARVLLWLRGSGRGNTGGGHGG